MTMKNKILFYAAITAFAIMSCNKNETEPVLKESNGVINFSIKESLPLSPTKTIEAYLNSQDYEKAINNIQIFVFDENGELNGYKGLGSVTSGSISTTVGEKTVWAVVNGPDMTNVKTESELKNLNLDLADNSKAGGFVMSGSKECTVGSASVNCEITVSRLVSRVALVSIENNLPAAVGELKIENVFLSNVVGNQNISGTAAASSWYNKEGRKDESSRNATHIIDGDNYEASCPELTFNGSGSNVSNGTTYKPGTPLLFYSYPNSASVKGDGFKDPFNAQRSVLVISASINNKLYYYPVVLDNATLERNKSYTVGVKITGFGSDDPNKEVNKGAIEFNVKVSDWVAGATYEEII